MRFFFKKRMIIITNLTHIAAHRSGYEVRAAHRSGYEVRAAHRSGYEVRACSDVRLVLLI